DVCSTDLKPRAGHRRHRDGIPRTMRIGVPREIKDGERRVGVTPAGARALAADGHAVLVERGAGANVGFDDAQYHAAGAQLTDAGAVWTCDLVVKVKEVLPPEYPLQSA